MLFNPKWNREKTGAHSLESLIDWLETQDSDIEYTYTDPYDCLLCRYYMAMGFGRVRIGPDRVTFEDGTQRMLSEHFNKIAQYNYDYRGALRDARKFLGPSKAQ